MHASCAVVRRSSYALCIGSVVFCHSGGDTFASVAACVHVAGLGWMRASVVTTIGFSAADTQTRMAIVILDKSGMIDHGKARGFAVISTLAKRGSDDRHLVHQDQPVNPRKLYWALEKDLRGDIEIVISIIGSRGNIRSADRNQKVMLLRI